MPSPTTAVWDLGPVPVRAYALFIVLGIVLACVVTELRLRARGAPRWAVLDIAVWAVPFGIVGARLYHVITSPDRFFGEDGELAAIIRVWEGGLGIWGAIAGGALGAWLACRQLKLPFLMVADAAAVGIPLAQAVGRIGNWFNNELYGAETTLPWGLEVHRMVNGQAVPDPVTGESALPGLYHPTFLYEALWCVGVAVLVWLVGKQLRLGAGRQFALYVMAYTAGRAWIEMLRIDDTSEVPVPGAADTVMTVLGLRVNVWVAAGVFLAALVYFIMVRGPQEFLVQRAEGEGFEVVTEEEFRAHQAAAGDPEVAAETHGGPPGQRDAATAESSEPTSPGPDRD
ncbi:prolipoprotein diacylglyceryl transferase [Natronosporangium hydrolyticum]|uniref:Phosphatidylglycerol--prolipoprotein diacylglyceryl transferase n=1 Tax=Natronosporangium hydrolyticum TaxID=2811111 RepID=A0A895YMK9_9ACTN|nr:prolipoprotein diacylglyceryl transferase [Natronosporangium hydrolyticum]